MSAAGDNIEELQNTEMEADEFFMEVSRRLHYPLSQEEALLLVRCAYVRGKSAGIRMALEVGG